MGSLTTEAILNFIATISVAIIGMISVMLQIWAKKRESKKEDIIKKVYDMITANAEKSNAEDQTLREEIAKIREESIERCNNQSLINLKIFLVSKLSQILNGMRPTEEEIRVLYEAKEGYNKAGGDSYVDDMFEQAELKEKIKRIKK